VKRRFTADRPAKSNLFANLYAFKHACMHASDSENSPRNRPCERAERIDKHAVREILGVFNDFAPFPRAHNSNASVVER
jgi:hypothetical protein